MKAQTGVNMYLYSFFNLGGKFSAWSKPRPGRFTTGKDLVRVV